MSTAHDHEHSSMPVPATPARRESDNFPNSQVRGVLLVVALLLAGGAGALALYGYFLQRVTETETLAPLRTGATTLANNVSQLAERQQATDQQVAGLVESYETLAHRDPVAWKAAEADYLLTVAGVRLSLEHDVAGARSALLAADQHLLRLNDPSLIPVRELIARDAQALAAINQPDLPGMALALANYARAVDGLPLIKLRLPAANAKPAEVAATEPAPKPGWRDLPSAVWKDLKGLVVIRRTDTPAKPLLPPEQEWYLRQNLRLKLEQAQLALLRRDTPLFQALLRDAAGWLDSYFDTTALPVMALKADLLRQRTVELSPALPDTGAPLRSLRAWTASRDQPRVREKAAPRPEARP